MTLLKNVEWGLRWGLTIAVGFTVVGLIGNVGCYLDPKANCEPSLAGLIGFYFSAGLSGGLILGLLRPIAKYKVGELFLGVLVVAICLTLLNYRYVAGAWTIGHTILVLLVSLIVGPIGALMIRHARSAKNKPDDFDL